MWLGGGIYIVPCNILLKRKETETVENILRPLKKWVQIDALGIKLSRHCNLNCIRCNNFSNISEPGYYYPEELDADLRRLCALVPDVLDIELIGGEPLLNPEIIECIHTIKKYYPYSRCRLVTNGLLLKNLDTDIINCFRENRITITMTLYPVMQNSVDEVAEKLIENEVLFKIYRSGEYFIPILNEAGKYSPSYIEKRAINKCVSFYKGSICRCTPGLNIAAYNQKFYKSFPETGVIDIYEEGLTGEQLVQRLDEPLELCKYCNGCLTLDEKEYGKKWSLGEAEYDDWFSK